MISRSPIVADAPKRQANVLGNLEGDEPDVAPKKQRTRHSQPPCMVCKDACEIDFAVMCTTCGKDAHLSCINMTQAFYTYFIIEKKTPWTCPICNSKSIDEMQLQSNSIEAQLTRMNTENEKFKAHFHNHELKFSSQQKQMEMLVSTMSKNHETNDLKFEHIQAQIQTTEDKIFKELCFLQGLNRQDEILINGVPQHPHEDLKSLIITIVKSLHIKLTSNQIIRCHRLGNNNTQAEHEKIHPILVKFADKDIREAINNKYIQNLTSKIYLTTSILDENTNERIYFNAHLPQCLTPVYKKAMELRKQGLLGAVNARINHIQVKYNQKAYKIHTMNELAEVMKL